MTFWNASRSPPPQFAMTVMVRLAAADADAAGVAEPPGVGDVVAACWQAVATIATTTRATLRNESPRGTRTVIRSPSTLLSAFECRSRAERPRSGRPRPARSRSAARRLRRATVGRRVAGVKGPSTTNGTTMRCREHGLGASQGSYSHLDAMAAALLIPPSRANRTSARARRTDGAASRSQPDRHGRGWNRRTARPRVGALPVESRRRGRAWRPTRAPRSEWLARVRDRLRKLALGRARRDHAVVPHDRCRGLARAALIGRAHRGWFAAGPPGPALPLQRCRDGKHPPRVPLSAADLDYRRQTCAWQVTRHKPTLGFPIAEP